METADDVFVSNVERGPYFWGYNDSFVSLGVDADHSGGPYFHIEEVDGFRWSNRTAQSYVMLGRSPAGLSQSALLDRWAQSPRHFAELPPYAQVGGAVFSEKPTITVTGFFVTTFDALESESTSQVVRLEPGRIIGIALMVFDQDLASSDLTYVNSLGYATPASWCYTADMFADALLEESGGPPAEEGSATVSSWARIKAGFSLAPASRRTSR